jgi:hypothetical protein
MLILWYMDHEKERVFYILAHKKNNRRNLGHVGKDGLMFKCYIWAWNLPIWLVSFDFLPIACDYICVWSCNGSGSPWLFLIIIYWLVCPWQVHFIVIAFENMISGGGMRLRDIFVASNGKTIEVCIEWYISVWKLWKCHSCLAPWRYSLPIFVLWSLGFEGDTIFPTVNNTCRNPTLG